LTCNLQLSTNNRRTTCPNKLPPLIPGVAMLLGAITPHWQARVGDYEAFTSDAMQRYLEESDLHVIQFGALRDAMRAQQA
jgi:hypothetical protein